MAVIDLDIALAAQCRRRPEKCSYQDIVWYNIMRNVTRCLDYLVVGEALRRATVRGGACLARPTGRVPP